MIPIAWYMPDAEYYGAVILHSDREKYRNTPYWSKAQALWPVPLYEKCEKCLPDIVNPLADISNPYKAK